MRHVRGLAVVSTLGLVSIAACGDGQAPAGYRGEPLMSLKGSVTSSESALTQDLAPALVVSDEVYDEIPGQETLYFLMGDVEGSFPNAFTLRLYEAPPPDTLFEEFEGEPSFAHASLVAVSPKHPAWLKTKNVEVPLNDGSGDSLQVCSETDCISGDLWKCPLGLQDPDWEWPCGTRFPDALHWNTYGYSKKHKIVYFDADVPADSILAHLYSGGTAIPGGYQIFTLDMSTIANQDACFARVRERTNKAWGELDPDNLLAPDVTRIDSPEDNLAFSRLFGKHAAEEGCDFGSRLADRNELVELEFVDHLTGKGLSL